jgi:hypothetical protein
MLAVHPTSSQDQHHLQAWIGSICQCRATAIDAHTNTTNQIAHANRYPRPEQSIAGVIVAGRVYSITAYPSDFGGKDDGHDDSVDGDDFAKDDGDEILGSDSRRFHTTTEDGGACYQNAPGHVRMDDLECTVFEKRTMLLLQLIIQCRDRCLELPMCAVICFRGRLRPRIWLLDMPSGY